MKLPVLTLFCLIAPLSFGVQAADCGEQPYDKPVIPKGETATPQDVAKARDAVVAFSRSVDEWLQCMDERTGRIGSYLSRDQRARLSEDLTNIHQERQDLQRAMNAEIRKFRQAQRGR